MTLRTVLVAASGGTASEGAVETACRTAERTGAGLEGLHVKTDPQQVVAMMVDGMGMPLSGEWFDRLIADAGALAEKAKAAFEGAANRHNFVLGTRPAGGKAAARWRVETGYAPIAVARRARFFDLVVLGRSERVIEQPHSDTIEETLIRSGRPVLLAPARPQAEFGDTIAIGWNGSAQAVHAVTAALPLLEKARTVVAVTVGGQAGEDAVPLLDYLASHGIAARHCELLPVKHAGPGEQLLAEAREIGADLLVMGAYGHRPWRESLFGGATREIVGSSPLPVLLAH